MILQDSGTKIGKPWIGRGDCPARLRCAVEPEDTTGASSLVRPKNAVAIYAEASLATEIRRRVRPVAPLNIRGGFRGLACRDRRCYRSDHFMVKNCVDKTTRPPDPIPP
jgi:hypothetical protein